MGTFPFLSRHFLVTWVVPTHIESMGKVIHFPVPQPAAAHPRVRRVFEAQREMEKAQHHAQMMMLGAFLTASLMMIALAVVAAVW